MKFLISAFRISMSMLMMLSLFTLYGCKTNILSTTSGQSASIQVSIAQTSTAKVTVTVTNNGTVNVTALSSTISSGLSTVTYDEDSSSCQNISGGAPLTPTSTCVYVYEASNANSPATSSGTITLSPTFSSGSSSSVVLDGTADTYLFAALSSGNVYQWNGSSWSATGTLTDQNVLGFNNYTLYAGGSAGVDYFASSWQALSGANAPTNVTALTFDGSNNVYAAQSGDGDAYVDEWDVNANPQSWSFLTAGLSPPTGVTALLYYNGSLYASSGAGIQAYSNKSWGGSVAGSPVDATALIVGIGNYLFASNSSGIAYLAPPWTSIPAPSDTTSLVYSSVDNDTVYAGTSTSGSLYACGFGPPSCTTIISTSPLSKINALTADSAGNIYAGSGNSDSKLAYYSGSTWTSINLPVSGDNINSLVIGNILTISP